MKHPSDDILAIHDVIYRFCHEHDGRNAVGVAECHAESAAHLGAQGRDGIRELYENIYQSNSYRRRHVLTNPIVDMVDADTAQVRVYEQLYLIGDDFVRLALTGIYVVDVVREGSNWKILRLDPRLDVPYDLPDNPHITSVRHADGLFRLARQ